MKFNKILVPLDFSASSEPALGVARDLARAFAGTLILLHVREPLSESDGQRPRELPDTDSDFDLRLEAIKLDLEREGGVTVLTRCLSGPAAAVIIELAEREGADLIVMGTHGRTGLRHLIMGSVAERVVRRAACPVLTLKLGSGA